MAYERKASQITGNLSICSNSVFKLTAKKTSNLRNAGPLLVESTGNLWIPLTKGQ